MKMSLALASHVMSISPHAARVIVFMVVTPL
jgi:hypothetical protein